MQPSYTLPSFEESNPYESRFLRDNIDVSDIEGTAPKVPRRFEPRVTMKNDIEGAQANWRPRHERARLERPPKDILDVADITSKVKPFDLTKRRTNLTQPEYFIHGLEIKDDPKWTKPKQLPGFIDGNHLLQTTDVNEGGKSTWNNSMRKEWKNLTTTQDIAGAQADTVQHTIQTLRETNPLVPVYQGLDPGVYLQNVTESLLPPELVTKPTIRVKVQREEISKERSDNQMQSARDDDDRIALFAAEDSAATTKVPPGKFKLDLTASAPAEAVSSQRTAMLQNFSSPAVSGRLSNRMTYVNSGRVGHSGINIISSSGRNVTNSSPAVSDRSRGSARVMNSSRSSGRMSSRDKATMRRRQEEISAVANLPN
jgi:hypothetical protein